MLLRLRSLVILVVSLAMLSSAVSATTLQFWTPVWNPAVQTWLKSAAIPEFEKENPGVKVEVMYGDWGTWGDKLNIAYAAGVFPDVYVMHAEAPQLQVNLGWALPLDQYIAKWPDIKDFIPVTVASATINGKLYGIPWSIQGPVMMMRRSVAAEVGLPETIPSTWAEFSTAARRMNRVEADKVTRRGYTRPTDQQFLNWVHSNGGNLFTPDLRTAIINKQEGVEALTFLTNLLQTLTPVGMSAVATDFTNKTVALKEEEPTFLGTLQQKLPEQVSDIAVGPPPRNTKHVVRVYVPHLAIGSQTKQSALAWRWIEYLQRPENVVTYNSLYGRLSPRISHLRHSYLKDVTQRTEILQIYSQYGIPHANWPPQDFALMRVVLKESIVKSFDGTISPQAALDEVARNWQVELDKIYKGK